MDWSAMRQFDESAFNKFSSNRGNERQTAGNGGVIERLSGIDSNAGTADFGDEEPEREPEPDLDPLYVNNWNDLKQFDDDHDREWFIEEEKRLGKEYGGNFVKVKYTQQGRVGYYCELCMSEMNAKKSLDLHCNGMKHLKKKNIFIENGQMPEVKPVKMNENPAPKRNMGDLWGPGHQTRDVKPKKERHDFGRASPPQNTRFNFPEHREFNYSSNAPQRAPYCPRPISTEPPQFQNKPPSQNHSPPQLRIPSPVKQNLSQSPAGAMLQKLAECCVKNGEDAELALNVVVALTKSLKDYNDKKGEKKVAELFLAAEIKLNTVKALESGLKLLGSQKSSYSTTASRQPSLGHDSRYSNSKNSPQFDREKSYPDRY